MTTLSTTPGPGPTITPALTPRPAVTSRPLQVGIVGAGKMAQHHARVIARLAAIARVEAVCDPNAQALEAIGACAPGAKRFSSLEQALAETRLDVVHVCTPPETHGSLAGQALRAGASVYVEKPFAESTATARELLALAEQRGLKVCAGHQLLYEPPAIRAAQLLKAVGQVTHIESYFSFRTVRRTPDGRVPLRADLQLLDILPHPVYLLLRFLEAAGPGVAELSALQVGASGTVHALVRRGAVTGTLVVTLEGRPVESYLRIVGTNGSIHADFVRGTVQRLIGPGTSGIDKVLAPFSTAWQLFAGTIGALTSRVLNRKRSYPGLLELFEAFYSAVASGAPSPVSPASIVETVDIWEQVARTLEAARTPESSAPPLTTTEVVVTGGTGFLGRELLAELSARGTTVRSLARRLPAPWERLPGIEYTVADLGRPLAPELFQGSRVVVHCAAETAGGWEQHQRNSLDATEHVIRAAAQAGASQVIHVSSLAVLAGPRGGRPVADESPLDPDSRARGPYVWGKLESERLAVRVGEECGLRVTVARPGALVDYERFDPPGRLGKRLGNTFVAVGSPGDPVGVIDVKLAARVLAWMVRHPDQSPPVLNLLAPMLPTRRELLRKLREGNPDLRVVWLPMWVLAPLSLVAVAAQKILRPGRPAIHIARVFARQRLDTSRIARLVESMDD